MRWALCHNMINTHIWFGPVACDVETANNAHLLGVALCPSAGGDPIYLSLVYYDPITATFRPTPDAEYKKNFLREWLPSQQLVGHNFTYDKHWLDTHLGIETTWIADTRIMWHLSSAPAGPFGYGLKDAQIQLLGWSQANDIALETEVKAQGGSLKKGQHYLASAETLSKYACLDVLSTIQVYHKLLPWFEQHDYTHAIRDRMAYNQLLETNTRVGVAVDREGLQKEIEGLKQAAETSEKAFRNLLKNEIITLEEAWRDRKLATYKKDYNKVRYLAHPEDWERFNINSDKHKRELFYDLMGLPVLEKTEGGKPQVSADAVKGMRARTNAEATKALNHYLNYETNNTIITSFGKSYLDCSVADSRLHPGFNICGTVSYRLSGFKPYLLNAPFDSPLMKHLKCDPGYTGVHTDLSAIEPTITAHFSDDPSLVKVFGQGLGDIYLDLALELFKNDRELQEGYNPHIPITKEVKERFSRQRKIAKVIQLAVQYTGTKFTVARNLTKEGLPTTLAQADGYVRAYWRKFSAVAAMNARLFSLNRQQGYLRNVTGRIIRVPEPTYKDLPNRFIQSSAHDVLEMWVKEIYRLCADRRVAIKPMLIDCHDSTSNQCPSAQAEALKLIYSKALDNINVELGLSVTIKAESKFFQTFAGLKGEE